MLKVGWSSISNIEILSFGLLATSDAILSEGAELIEFPTASRSGHLVVVTTDQRVTLQLLLTYE